MSKNNKVNRKMIDTAIITAAIAGVSALGVSFINTRLSKKVDGIYNNIDTKLTRIERYVATNEDKDKIREKMHNIQSYYANKITDEKCKSILIMKSETFIKCFFGKIEKYCKDK